MKRWKVTIWVLGFGPATGPAPGTLAQIKRDLRKHWRTVEAYTLIRAVRQGVPVDAGR